MFKLILLTLTGATMSLSNVKEIKQQNKLANCKEERDVQIIIQLSNSSKNRTKASVLGEQDSLLNKITHTITDNYKVIARTTNVVNTFALEIPSKYVSSIRQLKEVKYVDYNKLHAIKTLGDGESKPLLIERANSSHNPDIDNASKETMHIPDGTHEGEGTLIAILDSGFLLEHEAFTPLDSEVNVKLTESELASIASNLGETFHAKVDAEHSCYFSNKVPFYYDYGGEHQGITGDWDVTPDWDVRPTLEDNIHGTHVASIAGASGPYKGIAPKAQLALLKVFTEYTPTQEEKNLGFKARTGASDIPILQAIEDAAAIGADMVSMSLGTNLDDFDGNQIIQETIRTVSEEGMFVNVAAGNSGKGAYAKTGYEHWTTDMTELGILSSYANNPGSTVIAAAQADWQYYEHALIVNGTNVSYQDEVTNYKSIDGDVTYDKERYLTDISTQGNELTWVRVPKWGAESDYKKINVEGKVAVVDRGETTFVDKVKAAENAKASAIIIIDNELGKSDFDMRFSFGDYSPKIPVCQILNRDKSVFSGASGEMTLLQNAVADNPDAGQITSFTSDGATFDLDIKPEISTPGRMIKGAVLDPDDNTNCKYESLSGTSMAAPNYSGAQAVLISEHLNDENYRQTIVRRFMSTADPLKDDKGVNHTSVRFQGAGLLNVGRAMNSKVYLSGTDADGSSLNTAKINLRNNEDVKAGNVKLKFKAFNEGKSAITYTAKTYLYRPDTGTYSSQLYPEFPGTYMSIKEKLIGTKSETVTLQPGENIVELQTFSLSSSQKSELTELFPNGNYLDGYVILESSSNSESNVNIPFLGFFGDYSSQIPVEPFSFEKNPNQVYASDLVDRVGQAVNLSGTHYGSEWVGGYWDDLDDVDLQSVLLNQVSILDMKDGNNRRVFRAGEDPLNGEIDPNALVFGNNGFANTMIIQQFVNRSVSDNTITMTHKGTGDVVLVDHMFDSIRGFDESNEKFYGLFKSHIDDEMLDSFLAHRAYTIIPLYDMDDANHTPYPDGEYDVEFSYTLAATGSVYKVNYTITIDNESPVVRCIDESLVGKGNSVRIRYDKTNVSYAVINGQRYEMQHDSQGAFIDIPKKGIKANNQTLYIKSYNKIWGESLMITNALDKTYHLGITDTSLLMTYHLSYDVNDTNDSDDKVDKLFTVSVKKTATKNVDFENGVIVTIKLTNGLDPTTLKAFDVANDNNETEITDIHINGIYASFHISSSLKFRLTSERVENPPEAVVPENNPIKGGCSGNIIGSSILLVSISLSLLVFLLLRRKRLLIK